MGGIWLNYFYAVAWHLCSLTQPRGGHFFNFLRREDMTIQSENDEMESVKVETISWRTGDFVKIGNVSNWKIGECDGKLGKWKVENWRSWRLLNWSIRKVGNWKLVKVDNWKDGKLENWKSGKLEAVRPGNRKSGKM